MSTMQPQILNEEESVDRDRETTLDIEQDEFEDDEKAKLNSDGSSVDYKKLFEIGQEPCISMHTLFRSLDYASLITLNILVIFYYDTDKFHKYEIFWAIFVFAYISNIDGAQKYIWLLMAFDIGQYLLYLWFCSWSEITLIVFSILLFIMLCIKIIGYFVYKYGVTEQAQLIHKNIHQNIREYKFFKPGRWYNGLELAMLATTVPMFYFDQSSVKICSTFLSTNMAIFHFASSQSMGTELVCCDCSNCIMVS